MRSNNPVVSSVVKNYKYSQKAFLPRYVTIPLSQEYGTTYKCTVKPGDIVKEGQSIAELYLKDNVLSCIHSSVPGRVDEVAPSFTPNGRQEFSVKIKMAGAFSYLGKQFTERTAELLTPAEITNTLIRNGVINTFRTSVPENLGIQIKNHSNKNLVVRLFDEDPYRITDSLMSKMFFEQIVKGARLTAKALKAKGIVFAIDQKFENKKIFSEERYKDCRALEMNIRRYPCGTPREIVSAFTRGPLKRICSYTITKDDLFTDASTMYEVYKSVALNIPCTESYVHFSGNCVKASCLLEVKIGTTLRDIIPQIGGFVKEPSRIIINGVLCGVSVKNLDIPITKYVKSVEFISKTRKTDDQVYSCINCGNCRFACPIHLSPDILYNNTINFKLLGETFAASSLACIECGLCNTVCPSRLPLSQTIKVLKTKLTEDN